MKADFDLLVAGGGMVGAGLAALCSVYPSTRSLRVALLEPQPATFPSADAPLDLRVSALSRASQRLVERCGAWQRVCARGAAPYERMIVWDADGQPGGTGTIEFDAASLGEPDLGHIVENRSVQAALIAAAIDNGVTLLRDGIESLELRERDAGVLTATGRKLSVRLVAAADGGNSAVRRLAGIETEGWDYDQHAVVAHLVPEIGHGHAARQRFLPSGPLALLPLADGRVSLVWSTSPQEAARLVALDDNAFGEAVTAASAGVLGTLVPATPRAAFPLRLAHAREYTRHRLALVGDAAHTVHPLAGQGVNLGFMDAAALVQVLGEGLQAGRDPGEHALLRRYERWRKAENLPALALLDGLKRLFSTSHPALARIRRAGLETVDRVGPAKRALMERAMGLAGDVPTPLARDVRIA